MDGSFGKGARPGDPYPKLLDLIPNGGDWMERCGGEGGGRESLKLAEPKLELRLAPPWGEAWPPEKQHKEDASAFSLGAPPRSSSRTTNASAGAKRGFSDTLENQMQGFQQQQHQKASFLYLASTPGLARDSSQKANGTDVEQQQRHQGPEGKAGSPPSATTPSSGNAAASSTSSQARGTTSPVVGWPPIRSFRKNLTSSSSKPSSLPQAGDSGKAEKQEVPGKGKFVKINMDGVPIGRKVDLKAHDSYGKLSSAVDELFRGLLAAQRETPAPGTDQKDGEAAPGGAITGLLDGNGEYTLVYEDDEGDKLLVGDVPWDMFVASVKRLRVLKSSELSSLSLAAVRRKSAAPETQAQ